MDIKNPAAMYRPVPFWSWNDKLENEELKSQINAMHEVGIGGFFMHARGGLQTKYMSKEWFEAIETCIKEAEKLGMQPWLYDENGWPSGFGDGLVNGLGLEYQQKYLRMAKIDAPEDAVAMENNIAVLDMRGENRGVYRFYFDVNPFYVDTLSGEVTDKFLEIIYKAYKDKLPENLWKYCCGFFTDEPQISRNGIPWSFIMVDEYRKRYNRDLIAELPGLFEEVPNYRGIRVRFWKMVTALFMENFMKKIHTWCEEHGCKVTGHHVLEESLHSQLTSNGSIMPNYLYYHIPGVDWLTRNQPSAMALLQLQSASAQSGKKQLLAETFAMCGWDFNFHNMKWIYQSKMARGVNLLCQHLEGYTLRGLRKRDYPSTLFIQQPWWNEYKSFNDYVSRIGMLLANGEMKVSVLMLHPQSSAWTHYNADIDNTLLNRYNDEINEITMAVEGIQVNFHYGDETIIDLLGSVKNNEFVIGQQSYNVVILPPMNNISAKVKALLTEFVRNNGKVIMLKNPIESAPLTVDGEVDLSIGELTGKFVKVNTRAELLQALEPYKLCTVYDVVSKKSLPNIIASKRTFANLNNRSGELYYLVNQTETETYQAHVELPGQKAELFDAEKGEFKPFEYCSKDGKIVFETLIHPADSIMVFVAADSAATQKDETKNQKFNHSITLNNRFDVKLKTPNALTLDYCRYYVDGKLFSESEATISLMTELLKLERPCDLKMEFDFLIDGKFDLNQSLQAAIETPEVFKISLNGQVIDGKVLGYFCDKSFQTILLPGELLRHGVNTLTLETKFFQDKEVYETIERGRRFESEANKLTFGLELESIYIIGNFMLEHLDGDVEYIEHDAMRLNGKFAISNVKKQIDSSKMVESGLEFFAGTVELSQTFELNKAILGQVKLTFGKYHSHVVKVKINGIDCGKILWQPYELTIPGSVFKTGANTITLELTNALRNLLGPHHMYEGESFAVSPSSFFKSKNYLLHNPATRGWVYSYCLVNFGVKDVTLGFNQ